MIIQLKPLCHVDRYVAICFHRWIRPYHKVEMIPVDWIEHTFAFGFVTLFWERRMTESEYAANFEEMNR